MRSRPPEEQRAQQISAAAHSDRTYRNQSVFVCNNLNVIRLAVDDGG